MTEDEVREFLRDYLLASNGDGGDFSEWLSEYAQQRWNYSREILWDAKSAFGYPEEKEWTDSRSGAAYGAERLKEILNESIGPDLVVNACGYVQIADYELYRAVGFLFDSNREVQIILWSVYDDNRWKVMSMFGTTSMEVVRSIKEDMAPTEELARLRYEEKALETVRKKQRLEKGSDSEDDYWAMYDQSESERDEGPKSDESMDEDEYFAQYDQHNKEEAEALDKNTQRPVAIPSPEPDYDRLPDEQDVYNRIAKNLNEAWCWAYDLGLSQSDFDQYVKDCVNNRDYARR
ncbi:hypothetical protein TRVA0_001S05292 [Trichomonascus vanleenenianus]|uniref:uncharacterized protein n=1 Tax=Trichomonascus vanleenenianus TaxID=2268995 RepID=UPI003ECB0A9A